MQIALRVLRAINEKHSPDAADIEKLSHLAPSLHQLPADELACGVIEQELRLRADLRAVSPRKARNQRQGAA